MRHACARVCERRATKPFARTLERRATSRNRMQTGGSAVPTSRVLLVLLVLLVLRPRSQPLLRSPRPAT